MGRGKLESGMTGGAIQGALEAQVEVGGGGWREVLGGQRAVPDVVQPREGDGSGCSR